MAAPNPQLAETIRSRLEALERNPAWLARQLGLTSSTVQGWLGGHEPRGRDIRESLARALGYTSYGELVRGGAPDRDPESRTRSYGGEDPGEADEVFDQMLVILRSIDLRLAQVIDELRRGRAE